MKLDLASSILGAFEFEKMIDTAIGLGYQCLEVACWPRGNGERWYASVSHIDVDRVITDDTYAQHILTYSRSKGIEISALAFYPNTLDPDKQKRDANIEHTLKK